MDESRRRKFISISLLIVILSVVFFRDLKNITDRSLTEEKYVLIIGILSSPDNFQKRLSIRNTWLKLTTELSVSYYFIIGEKFCPNHPLDRISAYSCKENSVLLPKNGTIKNFFNINKVSNKKLRNSSGLRCVGFGFQTLHNVNIKGLGVLTSFMNIFKNDVTIKLISSDSKDILASVNVPYNHSSKDDLDFILLPVNNVEMEKGSEAQVLMEFISKNTSNLAYCEEFEWNFIPGVINYLQLFQAGYWKPWPFQKNSCSYVVMNYEISDLDMLKAHISVKEQRQKEWERYRKNLDIQLKNESKHFGDLAFVDVVDAYENLPQKLLQFFKWLTDTEKFDFVLKTDDDTFIDVLRVFQKVSGIRDVGAEGGTSGIPGATDFTDGAPHFWWWSNFRESWRVQQSGKWREDKYRSPAYPSFPCGGGYVLSKGLVGYLSENRKNLQYFQGEDVSIGIWLSALRTVQCTTSTIPEGKNDRIQESILKRYGGGEREWLKYKNSTRNKLVRDVCEWTCERETFYNIPHCNKVQLSVSEMYATWNYYIRYGFV